MGALAVSSRRVNHGRISVILGGVCSCRQLAERLAVGGQLRTCSWLVSGSGRWSGGIAATGGLGGLGRVNLRWGIGRLGRGNGGLFNVGHGVW